MTYGSKPVVCLVLIVSEPFSYLGSIDFN